MNWKAIGKSVIGTSHLSGQKACEDAIAFEVLTLPDGQEVLLCCVSDGAGSARHAKEASSFVTASTINNLSKWIAEGKAIGQTIVYDLVNMLYDALVDQASSLNVELNEFSCTFLGCIAAPETTIFFQLGDGVIVRDDGVGHFTTYLWPQNGEYQNTTYFLADDRSFSQLKVTVLDSPVNEISILTDGLQMLALNYENLAVHQPFFTGLFQYLRMADNPEKLKILDSKLSEYLGGALINSRTDDDKTLFLATRLNHE